MKVRKLNHKEMADLWDVEKYNVTGVKNLGTLRETVPSLTNQEIILEVGGECRPLKNKPNNRKTRTGFF